MRAHMVRVDTLQHHFVITNRDNEVAVIPPNIKIVAVLAGVLELKLVDAEREVGDRCVDPAMNASFNVFGGKTPVAKHRSERELAAVPTAVEEAWLVDAQIVVRIFDNPIPRRVISDGRFVLALCLRALRRL